MQSSRPICRCDRRHHRLTIATDPAIQNRGQRGSGVLGIHIERAGDDRAITDERSAEIELAADAAAGLLQPLRHDLAEENGLGEVLRADDDGIVLRARCEDENDDGDPLHALPNLRAAILSIDPNSRSAMIARPAAGSAPARIRVVSTIATPRKISVPSPPPPTAAPIVATPIAITVAMRSPPMIDGNASGSSTSKSRWRSVMPRTVAASRTSGSTPVIPVTVFRTIG